MHPRAHVRAKNFKKQHVSDFPAHFRNDIEISKFLLLHPRKKPEDSQIKEWNQIQQEKTGGQHCTRVMSENIVGFENSYIRSVGIHQEFPASLLCSARTIQKERNMYGCCLLTSRQAILLDTATMLSYLTTNNTSFLVGSLE